MGVSGDAWSHVYPISHSLSVKKGCLSVLHLNINRLRNKIHNLEALLEAELHIRPCFVCITETWFKLGEETSTYLPGYRIIANCSRSNSRGGGCVIFARNDISDSCLVCNVKSYYRERVFEVCCLSIKLSSTHKVFVSTVYRSPGSEIKGFLTQLELFLSSNKNHSSIMCGDFNIDLKGETAVAKDFLQLLMEHNMRPTIQDYTRVTDTSQTLVDNIFSDMDDNYDAHVVPCSFSDHDAQMVSFPDRLILPIRQIKSQVKRIYSQLALKNCKRDLERVCWNDILKEKTCEGKLQLFYSTLYKIIDKYFPLKKVRIKNHKKTWLTRGIKVSCRKKRYLLLETRKWKHDISLKKYYKSYNSMLKRLIFAAKNLHFKNTIQRAKSKSKAIWKIVNENTGKNSSSNKGGIKLVHNNKLIEDPQLISNMFNEYFVNAGKVSDNNANHTSQHMTLLHNKNINNVQSMFMTPISKSEIINIVKSLKNTSSCGPDDISTIFIKNNIEVLCVPLCDIFNACICEGVFPAQFKSAKVIPLHKRNSKTDISNYRPISLLPVISKVFERAIATRITNHFEKYNYFCPQQFGFRKNRNAVTAITELVLQVMNNLNRDLKCAGIFCDLSKAFDCVNHKILLDKLQYYGIRGSVLNLLKSYLTNRNQIVQISDVDSMGCIKFVNSASEVIDCGVPQGSVLGPLLFNIFINDLQYNITHGTPYLYADDTSIIVENQSIATLKDQICKTWTELTYWFQCNGLNMNLDKTLYLPFLRHTNSLTFDLPLPVVRANSVKFLGVQLDTQLRWSSHVTLLKKRLASACYALKNLSKMLSTSALRSVYFAYFESILRYGLEVWGNNVYIDSVLILQKKAIRCIERAKPLEHCRPLFVKHGILTVIALYIYLVCIFIYKNKFRFVRKSNNTRPRRLECKFDIKLPNSKNYVQFKRSIEFNGIKIYNYLNEDIKNCNNVYEFSKKLKSFLIVRPFYSLKEYFDKLYE